MKLVTAIMLTRNRNVWAAIALNAFLNQTYPHKQLLILDDRDEPSFQEVPQLTGVSYLRSDSRSIAEKRNFCCEFAAGDVICHWDDDDYSAPERMADQVKRLEDSRVGVVGYHSMLFYDGQRTAKYVGHRGYALGTSLMFTREYWKQHPFRNGTPTPNVGEDNHFVKEANDAGELVSVDAGQLMVARAHPGNTSPKDMNKFCAVPPSAIPRGFFE